MSAAHGHSSRPEKRPAETQGSRVCDRCISNKVKCDLKRPLCSRCAEGNYDCVYSMKRRKPGPARGVMRPPGSTSRRKSVAAESTKKSNSTIAAAGQEWSTHSTTPLVLPATRESGVVGQSASRVLMPDEAPKDIVLEADEELLLLRNYFEHVQPAIPIFARQNFFERYEAGFVDRELVLTMVAITAKLLRSSVGGQGRPLDSYLESALESSSHRDFQTSEWQSLDQFRKVCLLAYYEFHHCPGQRPWMRVGRLTRHAYRMGLNQLENPRLCSVLKLGLTTDVEVEEWRYIWWCIYCFDSYSNMSCGTPYIVELEGINTALPVETLENLSTIVDFAPQKAFLAPGTDTLWETVQVIRSNTHAVTFNIHIVTTTILREVGSIARLMMQNRHLSDRTTRRMATIQTHLHALRLSLPANHLKPGRDVMQNESNADHHLRLTSVLHLHLAQLLVSLPLDSSGDIADWITKWHEMLGSCHDIASVAAQWDNQYSPSVDPAVCFIVFTALICINVQIRCGAAGEAPDSNLKSSAVILSLFLEQFSAIWALPKRLLELAEMFQSAAPGPVTYEDIRRLLGRFEAPLHPIFTSLSLAYPASLGGYTFGNDFTMDATSFDFETFFSGDVGQLMTPQ